MIPREFRFEKRVGKSVIWVAIPCLIFARNRKIGFFLLPSVVSPHFFCCYHSQIFFPSHPPSTLLLRSCIDLGIKFPFNSAEKRNRKKNFSGFSHSTRRRKKRVLIVIKILWTKSNLIKFCISSNNILIKILFVVGLEKRALLALNGIRCRSDWD